MLQHLAAHYDVAGLDISPQMLRIARAKLPKVRFFLRDMTAFDLGRTFDAVICVYDSINHLLRFREWRRVFRCAAKHLPAGGVLIFDINTEQKLRRHIQQPAWVKMLDNGPLIMKVTDAGKGISNWNIQVFERERGRRYRLYEENILETSFSVDRISDALGRHFSAVCVVDPAGVRPSAKSDRLYFVCRHG